MEIAVERRYFCTRNDHSKGVLFLIKGKLDFELLSCSLDSQGRFIILKANVQDQLFYFFTFCTPNKTKEQCTFFQLIQSELDKLNIEADDNIIIGGDFNVILNPELDGLRGKPKLKDSVKIIDEMRLSFDLMNIWRIRNPDVKHFSWRQKNPWFIDVWIRTSFLPLGRTIPQLPCLSLELRNIIMALIFGNLMQAYSRMKRMYR